MARRRKWRTRKKETQRWECGWFWWGRCRGQWWGWQALCVCDIRGVHDAEKSSSRIVITFPSRLCHAKIQKGKDYVSFVRRTLWCSGAVEVGSEIEGKGERMGIDSCGGGGVAPGAVTVWGCLLLFSSVEANQKICSSSQPHKPQRTFLKNLKLKKKKKDGMDGRFTRGWDDEES